MKTCKRCLQVLPMADFYRHSQMADGHLSFCMECVKTRLKNQRRNDPRVLERERKRGRKFDQSRMKKYAMPEVRHAQSLVLSAIRCGRLERPTTCAECGDDGSPIEGAHEDYAKPLEVRWLCRRCHRRWDSAHPKTAALRAPF